MAIQRSENRKWMVIGIADGGAQTVLSLHTTESDAKQQRLAFLENGLEGYAMIRVERGEDRENSMSGNVIRLRDAIQRTPPVDAVEALRKNLQMALFGAVTPGDVTAIAEKLKERALAGDMKAMKLFLDLVSRGSAEPTQVQQNIVVQPKPSRDRKCFPVSPTTPEPDEG